MDAEAIMGLDFLESNGCVINTFQGVIHLKGRPFLFVGMNIVNIKVCERLHIHVPAYSGIENLALTLLREADQTSTWLVEVTLEEIPVLVASTIVMPKEQGSKVTVPVRLVNPSLQPIVINKGTKIAQMSICDESCAVGSIEVAIQTENQIPDVISPQKQQALWSMVEQSDEALSGEQQLKLHNLLLGHAEVFAVTDNELGRTNQLTHTISTRSHTPIRQHARRMPPYQKAEVKQLLEDMLAMYIIQPSKVHGQPQ